ncbi:MAG: hypothetical protein AVDCRST_MAG18-846, partial [uncultured Thermomicrobiales bacterium]
DHSRPRGGPGRAREAAARLALRAATTVPDEVLTPNSL